MKFSSLRRGDLEMKKSRFTNEQITFALRQAMSVFKRLITRRAGFGSSRNGKSFISND